MSDEAYGNPLVMRLFSQLFFSSIKWVPWSETICGRHNVKGSEDNVSGGTVSRQGKLQ